MKDIGKTVGFKDMHPMQVSAIMNLISESIYLAMLLHLQKQIQDLHGKLEAIHDTANRVDSRSVSDSNSDGPVDSGEKWKPLLLR